jgi:hypothetical protein
VDRTLAVPRAAHDFLEEVELRLALEGRAPPAPEHGAETRGAQEARQRDAMRAQTSSDPAALAGVEKKVQELRMICETAIAAHVREVATHMAPEQGRRYLALVLPKIKDFDHQGAANVRVEYH